MSDKQAKLNVRLTENYRLTADSMQYILCERKIVDPTKAPNWPARAAEGADPAPREKWDEVGYYLRLDSVINAVAERELRNSGATTLAELIAELRELKRLIAEAVK